MASEDWIQQRLAELCESIDYGFTTSAKEEPVGPKFLRITDIVGGCIDWDTVPYCEIDPAQKAKYRLDVGDIVIARTGATTGYSAYLSAVPDAVFASYLVRLKVREPNDPRFVAYCLKGRQFWDYMHGVLGDKSAQPNASATTLTQAPITVPPPDVQRRIANILGSLDDKIELNRRMSRTLEKMAAAIFKSWFIDFDPVRAKAEGRDPTSGGLPADIAALFPDSFEDSSLGPIPKGWDITTIDEVAETIKGRSYKSVELQPSDVALVTLKSFMRGGGYREDGLKPYTGKYKPEQVVQPGELIVAMTDVTQNADVIGRPAIVMPDDRYGILVASLDTSIVRPTSATVSTPFLYALFSTERFRAHTYAHSSGTTVLHLAKNAIPSFQFACPTERIQKAFLSLVKPLRARQMAMHSQNHSLAGLRDTLLPKLLSGEIEIPVAEELVEGVEA